MVSKQPFIVKCPALGYDVQFVLIAKDFTAYGIDILNLYRPAVSEDNGFRYGVNSPYDPGHREICSAFFLLIRDEVGDRNNWRAIQVLLDKL